MGGGKPTMPFLLTIRQDSYASVVPRTTGLMASWDHTAGGVHTDCLIQLRHLKEEEVQSERSGMTCPQSYN